MACLEGRAAVFLAGAIVGYRQDGDVLSHRHKGVRQHIRGFF